MGAHKMEHRCGSRRPAATKVRLKTSNGVSAEAQICEISASGALLRSHLPVSLHSVLTMRLLSARHAPNTENLVVAEVIRHVTGGFAVEWTEFSPQPIRFLLTETKTVTMPRPEEIRTPVEHNDSVVARER
jgi:PilZ domain-containing protein